MNRDYEMDRYFKIEDVVNGYHIMKIIGQGKYGIAYLGMNMYGEKCVIKQLKRAMLERTGSKVVYEMQVLESLDDDRFPRFISKFKDEYREGYILEYIEGKVFYDLLRKEKYKFSRPEIYKICSQLLEIVEELQNNNIVHRDIRTPNVILREDNELALIDFGLARFIDDVNYKEDIDYWFIGDFLIHLYYSSYKPSSKYEEDRPWYEELDLNEEEDIFLKRLMGLNGRYYSIDEIRQQLEKIIRIDLIK